MSVTKSRKPRRPHSAIGALIAASLACIGLVVQAPVAGASSSLAKGAPNAGVIPFTGDVDTIGSDGNLIPVSITETPASAPLYNFAGDPLNVTWGQFSSATATSLAKKVSKKGIAYTDFRITLSGLIPGGVYSLFYETFTPNSANPVCGTTGDLDPLVALTARHPERQHPDADSFVSDTSGQAKFHARVTGNLLAAQDLLIDVIYHFDGKTYGPVPNAGEANDNCRWSFGIDAMRQIAIVQTSP
jgi:hypothetical protein